MRLTVASVKNRESVAQCQPHVLPMESGIIPITETLPIMAFKEIDPGPAPTGSFYKFKAIGDKFAGVFVSKEIVNKFEKPAHEYTFKNKEGVHTITANYDLRRRLDKADLKPGFKVLITFASELPPEKPGHSAMKQFKVLVDDGSDGEF